MAGCTLQGAVSRPHGRHRRHRRPPPPWREGISRGFMHVAPGGKPKASSVAAQTPSQRCSCFPRKRKRQCGPTRLPRPSPWAVPPLRSLGHTGRVQRPRDGHLWNRLPTKRAGGNAQAALADQKQTRQGRSLGHPARRGDRARPAAESHVPFTKRDAGAPEGARPPREATVHAHRCLCGTSGLVNSRMGPGPRQVPPWRPKGPQGEPRGGGGAGLAQTPGCGNAHLGAGLTPGQASADCRASSTGRRVPTGRPWPRS